MWITEKLFPVCRGKEAKGSTFWKRMGLFSQHSYRMRICFSVRQRKRFKMKFVEENINRMVKYAKNISKWNHEIFSFSEFHEWRNLIDHFADVSVCFPGFVNIISTLQNQVVVLCILYRRMLDVYNLLTENDSSQIIWLILLSSFSYRDTFKV